MQNKESLILKTRGDFINWLFNRFHIPESRQFELKKNYENELPQDCDFEHLRKTIETKWRTPNSIPFASTLKSYVVSKRIKRTWGEIDPVVLKARKNKEFFMANYAECQAAMNKVMDKVEQLWGKRPGKERKCF